MKIIKRSLFLFLLCLVFAACKKDQGMPTVTDVDGNVYHTVKIGTQTWMVENLKTTKLNDKSLITNISGDVEWTSAQEAAYCWYNNDIANKTPYGALYNWAAVNTGKLAPKGWHVATKADWETLLDFIGGATGAAPKLREKGLAHWQTPNVVATDEYKFRLLPNGSRNAAGEFNGLFGSSAYIWSSTPLNNFQASALQNALDDLDLNVPAYDVNSGFGVRCIKD